MAHSVKVISQKRENFKKIAMKQEKTKFKKSLQRENFEDDEAFASFKPIKKNRL